MARLCYKLTGNRAVPEVFGVIHLKKAETHSGRLVGVTPIAATSFSDWVRPLGESATCHPRSLFSQTGKGRGWCETREPCILI
jgi:hypothetical protein